jgi:CDGSH-type Zn-finger protein
MGHRDRLQAHPNHVRPNGFVIEYMYSQPMFKFDTQIFTHISRGALLRAWRDDWRDTLSRSSYTRCVRAMHRFRAPSVAFRRALSDAVHTPVRAGNAPIKFDAVKDKPYSWCTCGLSKKQPLCDGSHKGTGLKSLKVVPTESKPIMLCTCKLTKNTDGGCDGSHKIPVT